MPLYDFTCLDCERTFETLVSASDRDGADCPGCGSTHVARSPLARFAVGGAAAAAAMSQAPAGPCGTCGDPRGPGSCALD
jgi:putative FmdB family regulatory protein